jgi:hypothetical protein
MKTNNFFCFKRAILLLKRILFIHKKSLIIGVSVYLGISLLLTLIFINEGHFNPQSIKYSSFIFMFIFGFVFTNSINKEIHKPSKAFSFLTLPVSHFERLLVTWLVSSLLYTAIYTFIIYYVIELSSYYTYLYANTKVYTPAFSGILKLSLYYMVFQAAYFFGSIFFKKGQFIKTSLSIIILCTVIIFLMVLIYETIIQDIWIGGIDYLPGSDMIYPDILKHGFINIITFYVTPIALLTATYFRIKEKQI